MLKLFNILASTKVPKTDPMNIGEGLLYSVVAILIVFTVLALIILITSLIGKLVAKMSKKEEVKKVEQPKVVERKSVEITDDDMMAAVLVATIDYRNETKKDVKVVSVKQIG